MDGISTIVALVLLVSLTSVWGADRPNIIFILADDLGWNDLSFHGSDQIPTPNIDALAYNGLILNNHYVPPICTPSRSALMTGKYPIHIGMQGYPMFAAEPRGLPLDVKILPEYLKDLGYSTKAIGKWHLGYHHKEYTPIYRGFDSHLGYWSGYISYYDYIIQDTYPEGTYSGFDMHRNMSPAYDLAGKYATDLFTDEAVRTINRHDQRRPLFMYLAHLAVHAGNTGKLVEAPQDTISKFQHIPDPNRRTYAAMVSRLDDSVGRVVQALQANGMLDNSIIVFMSDNGAPTVGSYANWGSNWPLRGMKITLWEGGVRNAAIVWSPLLQQTPRVSKQMMYMADWLPTLYSAAGGDISDLAYPSDGFDVWSSLVHNEDSPRKEILLNIDEKIRTAAIRKDNWKLIVGASEKGKYDGYFGESGVYEGNPLYNTTAVVNSLAGNAIRDAYYQSLIYHAPTLESDIPYLRQLATTECRDNAFNRPPCEPSKPGVSCLYDISNDPCEKNNLADVYKNVVRYLRKSLVQYRASLVPQRNTKLDPFGADPSKYNNTWVNWMDPEYA